MPTPSLVDVLRHIAREEPLTATVRAFRGLTREHLGQLLDEAAEQLGGGPREAEASAPLTAPESTTAGIEVVTPAAGGTLNRVRVYSDGAARGNPGPAGAGAVVTNTEGAVVARLGKFLGHQTNNYAEYMGLLIGLQHAKSLGAREVEVFADSELLIRQLGGRYQVKSPTLKPLFQEAQKLLATFGKVKLAHVPRAQNAEADEMSNRAIDERM
ncbi:MULTISPECIES: ribonuclease HI family protein [unclassified Corallococcus]|uniref:ribonuclease HI family protein n=1 Tax=unclassified Corallococcus TaxID=2685029 RepID=UPI001A8F2137|nr:MULTISPECIES: ribonuclease HI family protein [unclassified Corallococcus]MBN9683215.1 ribonuclease HI family protein [Corallococcus sp. NCSPR001]WAS85259.1 ribonuclease HI family protein [Corallococcus sp. NCRR]